MMDAKITKNIISKPLIVYHGSTFLFDNIEFNKGKPYKDFGKGFYVTKNRNHAINLAMRNKLIESKRGNSDVQAYLYTFEFNLDGVNNFKVKEFNKANLEWIQFVIANRKSRERTHEYEIVMGPTANDDTMSVINAYLDELFGEIGSNIALEALINRIKPDALPYQIYFASEEATKLLTQKCEVEIL